ncbi:MAG: hypothetical protein WC824_10790 [Bacteroidota bacterium]|jgi:hypothetical protein
MFKFLQKNLRSWSELTRGTEFAINPDFDPSKFLQRDGGLSYDHGKCRIGFNYHSLPPGGLNHYVWSLLRWIAVKVGRRRTFPAALSRKGSVPYTVYDGYEAWPVLPRPEWNLRNTPESHHWNLVDSEGFQPEDRYWRDRGILSVVGGMAFVLDKAADFYDKIIKAELTRLTKLWDQFNQ